MKIQFGKAAADLGVLQKYAFAILVVLVTLTQFAGHSNDTLMGDDLYNLIAIANGDFASNIQQMLFGMGSGKYRPVFQIAFGLLFKLFEFDLGKYILLNVGLHAVSSLLVYFTVLRIAPERRFVAFTAAALFATSRFAWYQLWQATGIVEGLSTFFLTACVYRYVVAVQTERFSVLWGVLALLAAACFTHERHLVFLPILILAVAVWPDAKRRASRAAVAALCVAIFVVNYGYKQLADGGNFFVGTGGTTMDFQPWPIIQFFGSAVANGFGFNLGPTYLSGEAMATSPKWVWLLSASIAGLMLLSLMFAAFFHRRRIAGEGRIRGPLIALAGAVVMAAIVASITIRQEFRWLLTVQLFTTLAVAISLASVKQRAAASVLAALLLAGAFAQTLYYRAREQNVFFVMEQYDVKRMRDFVDKLPPNAGDIYLAVDDIQSQCLWAYGAGRWFSIYGNSPESKVYCVQGMQNLPPSAASASLVLAAHPTVFQTIDVTEAAREMLALNEKDNVARISLAGSFDPAWLNSQVAVSTPSNLGAFQTGGWPTTLGPLESLVVTAGFNVSVPVPKLSASSELRFGVSMAYPTTNPALLWVGLRGPSGSIEKIWEKLMVGPSDGLANPQTIRVPLGERGPRTAAVVFGIDTPSGDSSSQWAVYSLPTLRDPTWSSEAQASIPPPPSVACGIVAGPPDGHSTTWCQGGP